MALIVEDTEATEDTEAATDAVTVRDAGSPQPADVGTRTGSTEDEPITGPVPVLELADGHVHVSMRRDVTIVEIDGGLDDDLAEEVAPLIASTVAEADAIVLDLDQTTLLDRTAVEAVCAPLLAAGRDLDRCIVSGRLSGRLVLERWEILDRFVVFSSVPDALQARAFIESGYGTGWACGSDLARDAD